MRKDRVFRFRLTGDEVSKLSALAKHTQRSQSAVLRLLLHQAQLTGLAEIGVRSQQGNAS